MKLIPAIDLMHDRVVRARGGARAAYATLSSPLCPDGDPLRLVEALAERFPFDTLYIADLDAIAGRDGNGGIVCAITRRLPGLRIWLDAGLADRDALRRFSDRAIGRPVIGSETLAATSLLGEPEARHAVLSLDYRGPHLLGPPGLGQQPDIWPRDRILMSLQRVGSGDGPDLGRLAQHGKLTSHGRLYSAGGVRHAGDIRRLATAGAAGVLLASALHDGRITESDVLELR